MTTEQKKYLLKTHQTSAARQRAQANAEYAEAMRKTDRYWSERTKGEFIAASISVAENDEYIASLIEKDLAAPAV